MQNNYDGKPLSEVPYEEIETGMEVVGARGTTGKIVNKMLPAFDSEAWIRIDWKGHPQQAKYHSQFTDVIVKIPDITVEEHKARLTVKAKYFTFEPIARGAVMHLTLYKPTEVTRAALMEMPADVIITPLLLWQKEESTDGDEAHHGPYEIMSVFTDPKNPQEILHVLFKDLDRFNDARE